MRVDGGCHCGQVRYEAEVDAENVEVCHCTDCQTLSGSAFRSIAPVIEGTFKLLSGELKCYVKLSEDGAKRAQMFCPKCGTHIYAKPADPGSTFVGIRVGTARQRRELQPKTQYWCRSALDWVMDLGSVKKVDTQ